MNYKNIKTLAIDLDGTVTNELDVIPNETLMHMKELLGLGIRFIICTARDINSALTFLENYFSNEEISKIGFVTSAGSHVYDIVLSGKRLILDEIYAIDFDIKLIKNSPDLNSFFEKYKDRISIKRSAILIPFEDRIEAFKNVQKVNKISYKTGVIAYLYHNVTVLSSVLIDKNKGLQIFMAKYGLEDDQMIRLADQGDIYEADFSFLDFENGYTVGSKNLGEKNKCNFVVNEQGETLSGVMASNYLFQNLINQLKK